MSMTDIKPKQRRPHRFNIKLATEFCMRMVEGRSVSDICTNDQDMPTRQQIYRWLWKNDDFRAMYEAAQLDSMRAHADDILSIADNIPGDPKRDRLRIDTRKWLLSKMIPKKYGDKIQVEGDGESKSINIQIVRPDDASAD